MRMMIKLRTMMMIQLQLLLLQLIFQQEQVLPRFLFEKTVSCFLFTTCCNSTRFQIDFSLKKRIDNVVNEYSKRRCWNRITLVMQGKRTLCLPRKKGLFYLLGGLLFRLTTHNGRPIKGENALLVLVRSSNES